MIVRNEADILRLNLLHHLHAGIDRLLVVDNGSSDGTRQILDEFAAGGRVAVAHFDGPFRQAELTTALAQEAYLQGADWVLPIDADEFWYAPVGDLRSVLERSGAGALCVEVVNFIQRRDVIESSPAGLLHMTRRTAQPAGPIERIAELVESREAAFVEIRYPSKWITRASPALEIQVGNHNVEHVRGEKTSTEEILCLHAPLRSQAVLRARVPQSRRYAEGGNDKVWHIYRWARLAEDGGLEREWLANSYEDGFIDVYGRKREVVYDTRLRDLVAPWTGASERSALPAARPDSFSFREPGGNAAAAIWKAMEPVEGWFSESEAGLLMATAVLAQVENPGAAIVEVGSFCGRSTIALGHIALAMGEGARVYAIDPHEGEVSEPQPDEQQGAPTFDRFCRNIEAAGVASAVEAIRKRSYEVNWEAPIGLLLIDGFHEYVNVARDFAHFENRVAPGGYVVFHDYDSAYPGVQRFVEELQGTKKFERFGRADSLVALRRIAGPEQDGMYNETRATVAGQGADMDRLKRLENGVALLRDIWKNDLTRHQRLASERDAVFQGLQAELHTKVGECNRIITGLQSELHEKVGQRDQVIHDLQAELLEKVGQRDGTILALQAELHEKVGDCNRVIAALQEQVQRLSAVQSPAVDTRRPS
jgi:glycosyltransferase involved in cell wall biosynthesis/predicted O-methyltransferase YrrM